MTKDAAKPAFSNAQGKLIKVDPIIVEQTVPMKQTEL